ncbi:MAG: hypothetical protein WCV55_01930 [Candidatus Paceibacterota bacterium]
MPTIKHRINITTDPALVEALKKIALRDKMPIASKATQLIEFAIEIEEDIALGEIVENRLKNKVKFVSHESAWK